MNRERVNKIIDRLADKTLSLGCKYIYKNEIRTFVDSDHYKNAEVVVREKIDVPNIKVLGHDVMIGDCLQAIQDMFEDTEEWNFERSVKMADMWSKWMYCGFTKSLQQIRDDAVWDEDDPKAEIKYKYAIELFEDLDKIL